MFLLILCYFQSINYFYLFQLLLLKLIQTNILLLQKHLHILCFFFLGKIFFFIIIKSSMLINVHLLLVVMEINASCKNSYFYLIYVFISSILSFRIFDKI